MRIRHLLTLPIAAALATVALTASAGGAQAASSEQVVFSKTGAFGTFAGTPTPLGFWIWCEASSGNPYQGQCNGSMYFYALGTPKHVVDGSITELADGIYQINVLSSKDSSINCTLTNTAPPQSGPNNTVTVSCATPSGSAAATGAVVNVTGPSS